MIHSLRQRHLRMFAVLAVILPAAFAVGVAARKPIPKVESLPAALMPKTTAFPATIWSRNDLFAKTPVGTVLLREHANAGRYAIQLSAPVTFAKPDLLVYWSHNSSEPNSKLPDNAVLLGAFSGFAPLQLPNELSSTPATLILYSLADREVMDVSKPVSLQ